MYSSIKISEFLHRKKEIVNIDPDAEYALVTVKLHHKGVVLREKKKGSLLGSSMYKISKGQFILSGIDARNGAFGIVPDELDGAIITNDFWCFDVDEKKVKRDFFYWLSNTPLFLDACVKSSKGETQRIRLQKDLFFNFEFHFPPINMQEDFLRGIQEFDFGLSLLRNEQTYQSTHLSLLRQTILQEAIEGKLTAKWRERHPELISGNNHASKLLEKIKAEKERLIKEVKIKKDKLLAPIAGTEKPFDLPAGWAWCRLKDVSLNIRYGFNASARPEKKDVRLLRITDIQNNRVDWDGVPGCVYSERDIKSYLLSENDIIIARTGGTIGKSFLIKDIPVRSLFASYLIRVIPSKNIFPEYLKYYLESPEYWKQLYDAAWGAGQPNVNGTSLSNLIVPLSPFSEQQAIVARLNTLMAMIEELEKQVSERKEQSEMLMQSVLREAFAKE